MTTTSAPWGGKRKFADRALAFTWHGVAFRHADLRRKDRWAADVLDKWDETTDAVYLVSGEGSKFPDTQVTLKNKYLVMEAVYTPMNLRRPKSRSGMVVLRRV